MIGAWPSGDTSYADPVQLTVEKPNSGEFGWTITVSEFSVRHRFMELLALPMVAFGLLMLGVLGI